MSGHRKPKLLPKQPGSCRWCGLEIRKPDGSLWTRRTWHPECVRLVDIAKNSAAQRKYCWERDRGKCRVCGKQAEDPQRRHWNSGDLWQADHIRPLFLGKGLDRAFFAPENLQTICTECHKAKNRADARAARGAVPESQLPLGI